MYWWYGTGLPLRERDNLGSNQRKSVTERLKEPVALNWFGLSGQQFACKLHEGKCGMYGTVSQGEYLRTFPDSTQSKVPLRTAA
ncbi:hypothetical protein GX51_04925 [Blastomyces parvus]|uniref:Uncharacterized protein n=1 Tax=Blastomyces parvus TaxID=2060905 RepID=A0A2B7WZK1_9EURO|nr:hypothetical protein GX51_04925 [Blastomyces parvus]